jgi:hypothetical protein
MRRRAPAADGVITSAAPAAPSAPATTAAQGSTTTAANSVASVTEKATKALLTPPEIGTGFVTADYDPGQPSDPTPCGTPSADASVPPGVKVGTVIAKADTQQALQQEIMVYTDPDEATGAFEAGSAGLACPTGTAHYRDGTSSQLTISGPVDVSSQVGGDEASAWEVASPDLQGVVVAVRLEAAVVAFQFQAPANAANLRPAPLTVVKAGVEKVLNS